MCGNRLEPTPQCLGTRFALRLDTELGAHEKTARLRIAVLRGLQNIAPGTCDKRGYPGNNAGLVRTAENKNHVCRHVQGTLRLPVVWLAGKVPGLQAAPGSANILPDRADPRVIQTNRRHYAEAHESHFRCHLPGLPRSLSANARGIPADRVIISGRKHDAQLPGAVLDVGP